MLLLVFAFLQLSLPHTLACDPQNSVTPPNLADLSKSTDAIRSRVNDNLLDEKSVSHLNQLIASYLEREQGSLIKQACPLLRRLDPPTVENVLQKVDFKNVPSENYTYCLMKLSNFFKFDLEFLSFLKKDPEIAKFFEEHPPNLALTQASLQYIKHERAHLAKVYFQTRGMDLLQKETGLSPEEIQSGIMAYGFNRLFSPNNVLGATSASDVDFKLIYDETKLNDPALREKIQKALLKAKEEMNSHLNMTMEVAKFTVQSKGEILNNIKSKNEVEMNFYATTIGNNTHLFGNHDIREDLFKTISEAVGPERDTRTFRQYIGPETGKLSLGAVIHIDQIREEAKKEGPGSRAAKLDEHYKEKMVGMPGVTATQPGVENVLLPTKEINRLADFKPEDPKASALFQVTSQLQVLKIRNVEEEGKNSNSSPSEVRERIDEEYNNIRVSDFARFMRDDDSRHHLQEIVSHACDHKLVQDICDNKTTVFSDKAQKPEDLHRMTFRFYEELVQTAVRKAQELRPRSASFEAPGKAPNEAPRPLIPAGGN